MKKRKAHTQNTNTSLFDCEKELDAINRNKPSIIKTEVRRISQLGKVMSIRQIYNEINVDNKPDYSAMSDLLKFALRRLGFSRDIDKKYFSESEMSKKLNELFSSSPDTNRDDKQ